MNIKSRKRISLFLVLALVLTMSIGTLAYFTDRTDAHATATAGDIDLTWADTSNQLYKTADQTNTQVGSWTKLATGVINPGDHFDLGYTLGNDGSKSIDVRQRIVLTSSVELTSLEAAEYNLTITGGKDTQAVVGDLQDDNKTIIYDLSDIILSGSEEVEADAVASGAYAVDLEFTKEAKNKFFESNVKVDLYVAAKQHRNTTNDADFPAFTEMASIMSNTDWETVPAAQTGEFQEPSIP